MNYDIEKEMDVTYTFDLIPETKSYYMVTRLIMGWLYDNLSNIKDTHDDTLFSKVNFGYNESTLKGFGKKPVCDVYLTNVNYDTDYDSNKPLNIHSVIICYLKGNMNNTYLKACELCDYLLQEFEENNNWREYSYTTTSNNIEQNIMLIQDTFVRNCELRIIPGTKTYGVLVAFELEHILN